MSDSLQSRKLYGPWNSLGQNTGVGSLSLLQGIFPTQGLNPGLPYCKRNKKIVIIVISDISVLLCFKL